MSKDIDSLAYFLIFAASDKRRDVIHTDRLTSTEKEIIKTPFDNLDSLSSKKTELWMKYNSDRLVFRHVAQELTAALQSLKGGTLDESKGIDNAPWTYDRRSQTIVDENGSYVAMIRGWGNLTGRGALGLSDEEAIKIQDDRGRRLAKVPEYEAEIARLQAALKEVPKLEARIAVLEAAIVNVTNRVAKQTDVTESIIVRGAHPSNKMSDGSHVIETLNLHIRDAVDEARAALTNDIEGIDNQDPLEEE